MSCIDKFNFIKAFLNEKTFFNTENKFKCHMSHGAYALHTIYIAGAKIFP